MENPEELVTFGVYPDAVSAYIVKGVLSTNGVECVVTNERMSGILPLPDLPVGRVSLLVFKKDLDMARRIIEADVCEDDKTINENIKND